MRSAECWVDGSDQPHQFANTKGIRVDTFCDVERLRKERRRGTIVVVRIVDRVRVELDLVVVELEVRGVREVAVGIRSIASAYP